MLQVINTVSSPRTKGMAANAAAAASKKAAPAGKQEVLIALGDRDVAALTRLAEEFVDSWLERAKEVGSFAADMALHRRVRESMAAYEAAIRAERKRVNMEMMVDATIDMLADASADGRRYAWEEARSLCLAYRSQALHEAKKGKGINKAFYFALAKALDRRENWRSFLDRLNANQVLIIR